MITCGSDGMMIPNPRLSMKTDSRTKVSAARDEVMGARILRHMSGPVLACARPRLHPVSERRRTCTHEPDRITAPGYRARPAAATLRGAGLGRLPHPLRQDVAHRVRAAVAHAPAPLGGRGGVAGRVRAHLAARRAVRG